MPLKECEGKSKGNLFIQIGTEMNEMLQSKAKKKNLKKKKRKEKKRKEEERKIGNKYDIENEIETNHYLPLR